MKKFFRNVFSGYFLVLLLLLVELGVFIFVQFFLEDVIVAIAGPNADVDTYAWIAIGYLISRVVIFIVAFIVFFRIINKI